MSAAERIYTPELLALTLELAGVPLDGTLTVTAEARSPTCGSTLALGMTVDAEGRMERIGLRARACAVGQAAAALFARHARGRDAADVARTLEAMENWLRDGGPQPDWPGLEMIAPAAAYPARHGAILLPWRAALAALSSAEAAR